MWARAIAPRAPVCVADRSGQGPGPEARPEARTPASAARDLRAPAGCYQIVSMANVLVRDLPDDVHAALQRRAEGRGQSLQQYLATELKRLAEKPSLEEVLDRIERRRGGSVGLRQAAEDLAAERERR